MGSLRRKTFTKRLPSGATRFMVIAILVPLLVGVGCESHKRAEQSVSRGETGSVSRVETKLSDADTTAAANTKGARSEADDADAHFNRGCEHYETGELNRAIADFTETIRLNPDHVQAYGQRSRLHHEQGDVDKAIADYTEIIRLRPNVAATYILRGSLYEDKGDLGKAIADFPAAQDRLETACRGIPAFEVELAEFRTFRHRRGKHTIWLAPNPESELMQLQAVVWRTAVTEESVDSRSVRFQPHLSVGQVHGKDEMLRLVAELQAAWQPVRFVVSGVSLIWRGEPPDDVFRVAAMVSLGGGSPV